jgi:excisionase family DNA binding protein
MTETPEPELLRVPEAARLLNISRAKAYSLIAEGGLPVVKVGASIRIPRRRLLAWLEENTREVTA